MSEVKLQLDIYNPGEFYAALGLLTVFSLQHPEAYIYSHFQLYRHQGESNAAFVISSQADLRVEQVADDLAKANVATDSSANVWRNPKEKNPILVSPVIFSSNGWSITLDWWLDELRYTPNNSLKLWSGNSNPADMLKSFTKYGEGRVNAGGTVFGFDTRASRDALEVGFSKKDTGERAIVYPRTEVLCAIGLQHYRPRQLRYYAWEKPLPLSITHAAAIQEIPGVPQFPVEFKVHKIGQGAKQVVPSRLSFMAAAGSQ
jgi:CRISPR-associated protein Csb3